MIAAVVYCFYAVSGGNVNPAVSWGKFEEYIGTLIPFRMTPFNLLIPSPPRALTGLAASGRMTPSRALAYTILQCIGGICGAEMAKVAK